MKAYFILLIFSLILIACHKQNGNSEVISPEELIQSLIENDLFFQLDEVYHVRANVPEKYKLFHILLENSKQIDSHTEYQFTMNDLFEKEVMDQLKNEATTVFLTGPKAREAFLILSSIGIEKILLVNTEEEIDPAKYDYAAIYEEARVTHQKEMAPAPPAKPKKIILRKKPEKKVEVEEEEGC